MFYIFGTNSIWLINIKLNNLNMRTAIAVPCRILRVRIELMLLFLLALFFAMSPSIAGEVIIDDFDSTPALGHWEVQGDMIFDEEFANPKQSVQNLSSLCARHYQSGGSDLWACPVFVLDNPLDAKAFDTLAKLTFSVYSPTDQYSVMLTFVDADLSEYLEKPYALPAGSDSDWQTVEIDLSDLQGTPYTFGKIEVNVNKGEVGNYEEIFFDDFAFMSGIALDNPLVSATASQTSIFLANGSEALVSLIIEGQDPLASVTGLKTSWDVLDGSVVALSNQSNFGATITGASIGNTEVYAIVEDGFGNSVNITVPVSVAEAGSKLLVDDFSDLDLVNALGDQWLAFSDSVATPDPGFSSISISAVQDEYGKNAVLVKYALDQGSYPYDPYIGVNSGIHSIDISNSEGIEFYYRGPAIAVKAISTLVTNYGYHFVAVPETPTWTKYAFQWSEFEQPEWGGGIDLDMSTVGSFSWEIAGKTGESSEFCLTDISVLGEYAIHPVTGLSIEEDSITVYEQESFGLTAIIEPDNATNKTVEWEVQDGTIASVSPNGVVTGISEGVTLVTATSSESGKSDSIVVTVQKPIPVPSIVVDDCDDKNGINKLGGRWFTYDDRYDQADACISSKSSVIQPQVFGSNGKYVQLFSSFMPGHDSGLAAYVDYELGESYRKCDEMWDLKPYAGVGTNLISGNGQPVDFSSSTGISFWYKGSQCYLRAITSGVTDYDYHKIIVPEATDWTKMTIAWSELKQEGWNEIVDFDPSFLLRFEWEFRSDISPQSGQLFIDDIEILGISPVDAQEISIPETLAVFAGSAESLGVQYVPDNATYKEIAWVTSDYTTVAVTDTGAVIGVVAGNAVVTAKLADNNILFAECNVTVVENIISVTGISVKPATASVSVGSQKMLIAEIEPESATDKNYSWTVVDGGIASVDAWGNVVGQTVGQTYVIATADDGGFADSCLVTVVQDVEYVTSITLTEGTNILKEEELSVGDTMYPFAYIQPLEAINKKVGWVSDNDSIAQVVSVDDQTAMVVAHKAGTAVITCTADDGHGASSAFTLNVTADADTVTRIELNYASLSLFVDQSAQLEARLVPSGEIVQAVTWSVDDEFVLTISSQGLATALSEGNTVLTATYDGPNDITYEQRIDVEVVSCPVAPFVSSMAMYVGSDVPEFTVDADPDAVLQWYGSNGDSLLSKGTVFKPENIDVSISGTYTFSVSQTLNGCESDKATFELAVVDCPLERPYIIDNPVICESTLGDVPIVVGASAASDVVWYEDAELTMAVETSTEYFPLKAGTYYVVQKQECTSEPTGVTVIVQPEPEISVQMQNPYCTNETINLYDFVSPENGTFAAPFETGTVEPQAFAVGTYEVTYTYELNGCASSKTEMIVLEDCGSDLPQSIELDNSVYSISLGETVRISYSVLPDGANQDVAFSIDDATVAKVLSDGELVALRVGEATVTLTAVGNPAIQEMVKVIVSDPGTSTGHEYISACREFEYLGTVYTESGEYIHTLTSSSGGDSIVKLSLTIFPEYYIETTATINEGEYYEFDNQYLTESGTYTGQFSTVSSQCDSIVTLTLEVLPKQTISFDETDITIYVGETSMLSLAESGFLNKDVRWESDDDGIVTVSSLGRIVALAEGVAHIHATSKNNPDLEAIATIRVVGYDVKFVELDVETLILAIGDTYTVKATVVPAEAEQGVEWKSSDTDIATVSEFGQVVAQAEGTVLIHAISKKDASQEATVALTVVGYDVESVQLDVESLALTVGDTYTVSATVQPVQAEQGVEWVSNDEAVAEVDDFGNVTAISAGSTFIYAISADGSVYSSKCFVDVKGIAVDAHIELAVGSFVTIEVDDTLSIGATVVPSSFAPRISYQSTDEAIVAVDENGVVTGIGTGIASIVVVAVGTDGTEITEKLAVEVVEGTKIAPITIVPEPELFNLKVGETAEIDFSVVPDFADRSVVYTSQDTNVVKMAGAVIYAANAGTADIVIRSTVDWSVFGIAKVSVTTDDVNVDNAELLATIAEARSELLASSVGASPGEFPEWAVADFEQQIEDAKKLAMSNDQGTIDMAKENLDAAIASFLDARISVGVDRLPLKEGILATEELLPEIKSNSGTEPGQFDPESIDALYSVLEEARRISEWPGVTQTDVNKALVDLESALVAVINSAEGQDAVMPTGITIVDPEQDLTVGEEYTFTVQFVPTHAKMQVIEWQIENAEGASEITQVSSDYTYTFVAEQAGLFTLYVRAKGVSATGEQVEIVDSAKITVKETVPVTSFVPNTTKSIILTAGDVNSSAKVYVIPANASDKFIVWSSSNIAVVAVDPTVGTIFAKSAGTATITARSASNPSVTALFTVVVNEATLDVTELEELYAEAVFLIESNEGNIGSLPGNYGSDAYNNLVAYSGKVGEVLSFGEYAQNEIAELATGLSVAISEFVASQVDAVFAESLLLNKSELTLELSGASVALFAKVLPTAASNKTIEWTSSDDAVATVQDGIVTPEGAGNAIITAKTTGGSEVASQCTVTVTVPVMAIEMQKMLGLSVGQSALLVTEIIPAEASAVLQWASLNPTVATVNSRGIVTAVGAGSAKIVAKSADGNASAICVVNVMKSDVPLESIVLPDEITLVLGEKQLIPVELIPAITNETTIFWESSNRSSATISYSGIGYVKALAIDTLYVYAFNEVRSIIDSVRIVIVPSEVPELLPVEDIVIPINTPKFAIDLDDLVSDDKTTGENLTVTIVEGDGLLVTVENGTVTVTPKHPEKELNTVIVLVVEDQDGQSVTVELPVSISAKENEAPVIAAIPMQTVQFGSAFAPLSLISYATDDFTASDEIVWSVADGGTFMAYVKFGNILVVYPNGDWTGTDTLLLNATDEDGLSATAEIVCQVLDKDNEMPEIMPIPVQTRTAENDFAPINLSDYVRDDYTQAQFIEWAASQSDKIAIEIVSGVATATVLDNNWVGAELIEFTATDQNGLSSSIEVVFDQQKPIEELTWLGKPEVSFVAERRRVAEGEKVFFHASITGEANFGYEWTFEGGSPAQSNDLNPVVTYANSGKYDVVFVAANQFGGTLNVDSMSVVDYLSVVGIVAPESAYCAGDNVTLTVSDDKMTSYTWSNGDSGQSTTVVLGKDTAISVVAKYGFFKYYDTIDLSIAKPVDLGADRTICSGDIVEFALDGYESYSWNGKQATADSVLSTSATGKITVKAITENGCVSYDTVIVTVNEKPAVSLGNDIEVCPGTKTTLLNTTPSAGTYLWSTGASEASINVVDAGTYSLTVTAENGCANADTVVYSAKELFAEELKVVTNSDQGGYAIVAWEATPSKGVLRYEIHRETGAKDVYEKIGEVNKGQATYFWDNTANVMQQAYRYKLVTVDEACQLASESASHRTMHLQYNLNLDGYANLSWTAYEGIDFDSYIIYKAAKGGILAQVGTVTSEATSWTDNVPYVNGDMYRVAVVLKESFMPNLLKSDSGPYSQSISNIAEAVVGTNVARNAQAIAVYPNPVSEMLSIGEPCAFTLTTLSGVAVAVSSSLENGLLAVDVSGLENGMYVLTLEKAGHSQKVLITKE